jgi:hypothetical protein
MASSSAASVTAEKERLFSRFKDGGMSFEQLASRIYELDHPVRPVRRMTRWLVGLFLPLLFVGRAQD